MRGLLRGVCAVLFVHSGLSWAQGITDDNINFPSYRGWGDLRGCIQNCLNCDNWGCYRTSVKTSSGCSTNKCICSPSHLWSALQFAYSCGISDCKDYDDARLANDTVWQYCSSKGHTSILAPVTATGSSTMAGTFTATTTKTVTAVSTIFASNGGVSVALVPFRCFVVILKTRRAS